MKIVLLTNILTPYRAYFIKLLEEKLKKCGDELTVFVMAETEEGRHWHYSDFDLSCTRLLKGKTVKISGIEIHIIYHLKNALQEIRPDIVIMAGAYLYPPVWQAIALRHKLHYKIFLWSETHKGELRDYHKGKLWLREKLRHLILSKFDGFWYAGRLSLEWIQVYEKPGAVHIFCPNLIEEALFQLAYSYKTQVICEENNIAKLCNEFQANAESSFAGMRSLASKEYQIDPNKFIFLCPARLIKEKGIDRFLHLYRRCNYRSRACIIIAGDGNEKEELSCYVRKNNLDVRFIGFLNKVDMIKLYSLADCFLLPSVSDANPISSIEALWSGLPMLVSENVGNHPETVIPGKNGYIFSYGKLTDAVRIIDRMILADKGWLIKAGNLSREIAEKNFCSDHVVERIINETKNAQILLH